MKTIKRCKNTSDQDIYDLLVSLEHKKLIDVSYTLFQLVYYHQKYIEKLGAVEDIFDNVPEYIAKNWMYIGMALEKIKEIKKEKD